MPQDCTYCSSSIDDGDAFCQSCGRQVLPANGAGALAENPEPAIAAVPTGGLPSWATVPPAGGLPAAATVRSMPSAAAGPSGADDFYRGSRLSYRVPGEPTFDPIGSSKYLGQIALRGVLYWLAWTFVYVVFLIITLLSVRSSPSLSTIEGTGGFLGVVFFLFTLALLVCFWFLKIPIQLSEWKITVDGQGAAAGIVFGHIAAVLQQRGTPIDPLRVQRFRLPKVGTQDYLELHSRIFYGYVACFAYGQDLYIGWTFWSRISPFRYLCMFIARIWQSLFNRGSDLYISLRYDYARAMRETMHSATREGVDVAIGRMAAQGQGIIGTVIPVTEHAVTE
jgi:hypothetical protein